MCESNHRGIPIGNNGQEAQDGYISVQMPPVGYDLVHFNINTEQHPQSVTLRLNCQFLYNQYFSIFYVQPFEKNCASK